MKINTFLLPVLLMLGSNSESGNVIRDINNFYVNHCNIKHSFVVIIIANHYVDHMILFSKYACSGALVKTNLVLTTVSCYDTNNGSLDFEKMEKPQNITVIAGFQKKYISEARVAWAWPIYTINYRDIDGMILVMLDKHFKVSPGVSIIKPAPEGKAEKCKHAHLVSVVALFDGSLLRPGPPPILDVHVVCSTVKVIDESVCTSLYPWVSPAFSLCGETKPRGWLDKFHLNTDSLVCRQNLGSPLACDGVLIGFQGMCQRNNDVNTSFIKIDFYLDLIDYIFQGYRSLKGKNKTTTGKPPSNGADFFDGTSWKMAAGIGTLLFLYF